MCEEKKQEPPKPIVIGLQTVSAGTQILGGGKSVKQNKEVSRG